MPSTSVLLFGGAMIAVADATCLALGWNIPHTPGACLLKAAFLAGLGLLHVRARPQE